jgi:hypothetical protein
VVGIGINADFLSLLTESNDLSLSLSLSHFLNQRLKNNKKCFLYQNRIAKILRDLIGIIFKV